MGVQLALIAASVIGYFVCSPIHDVLSVLIMGVVVFGTGICIFWGALGIVIMGGALTCVLIVINLLVTLFQFCMNGAKETIISWAIFLIMCAVAYYYHRKRNKP